MSEFNEDEIMKNWCDGAKDYWKIQSATVNGMLGGFDHLADQDIKGSKVFLNKIKNDIPGTRLALDVGAGIGRVSKNLLLTVFDKVSLLECTESFIEKARENIPVEKIDKIFSSTMQDFRAFEEDFEKYDLVWIQWVIIYASDDALIYFLKECSKLLKTGGKICIKDNVILPKPSIRGHFDNPQDQVYDDILLDQEDCSITRSERYLLELTKLAGLELYSKEIQAKFPKEIFPVVTYAFNVKTLII